MSLALGTDGRVPYHLPLRDPDLCPTSRTTPPTTLGEDDVTTPGASGEPLLQVQNLSTAFRTSRGILRAVDNVSFTLDKGETLGIVGESGSGKSVLVRSIMNILPRTAIIPPQTKVILEGKDTRRLTKAEAKHFWGTQIAMVFQDPMTSLNPVKKIGTQITDPLRFHLGMSKDAARARAIELLDLVRIPEPARRLAQYPHELSGGMRQRVIIAIALSCNPKLLVADEPTTALDVTVQKQILDLLENLQAELQMAMILITHDLGVVAGRADRIAVMYAGKMVETADTNSLFKAMRHPYAEALLNSIPKLENPSHTRLDAISGRPPDMVKPPVGCRFAPRCRYAQQRCIEELPELVPADEPGHRFACFFPVGTAEGEAALARNLASGKTATGLDLHAQAVS
jgi:peptide/nickel transport system ATP-binding protein